MRTGKRVLIVDDEENSRLGLGALLQRDGYQVSYAADAAAALAQLDQAPVDLVLSDIRMPGMNGLSLLEQVRQHYPAVQVILVTAHGDVDLYLQAINLGAFDFVHKPVKVSELKLVLDKLFHAHSSCLLTQCYGGSA